MNFQLKTNFRQSLNRQRWLIKPIGMQGNSHWLTSEDSLTAKLKHEYVDFSVQPTALNFSKANKEETTLVGLQQRDHALIREVLLHGGQRPVVFAHSVLPKKSLRGAWYGLSKLGKKPLGEALFTNPKVKRTPLRFKKVSKRHWLYQKALHHIDGQPNYLWARRSVFSLGCTSAILVTEVFLPSLINYDFK